MNETRDLAPSYLKSGLCVLPIRPDGSKAPAVNAWACYQERLPTSDEINDWFAAERGIAVVGGSVSGNLETLDFETKIVFDQWAELVQELQPGLLTILVINSTPGKYCDAAGRLISGRHVRYRVRDFNVPRNTKLAREENGKTLIETRGEGGYALAPGGSPQAHLSGKPYVMIHGDLSVLPQILPADRVVLINAARALNMFVESERHFVPRQSGDKDVGKRPGDRFNQRADWSFLRDHDWSLVRQAHGRAMWRRPGKTSPGVSATTGFCRGQDGTERLYVFSTNALPFEAERCYSPFAAYALLAFGGDFGAAAVSLSDAEEAGPASPRGTGEGHPDHFVHDFEQAAVQSGSPARQTDHRADPPTGVPEPWDVPTPLGHPGVPAFPLDVLPGLLGKYCSAVAESSQTPVDLVAHLVLANLGASLAGRVRVYRSPDHSEPLNVWMTVALPPANRKSSVFREVLAPAQEAERDLAREASPEIAKAKQERHLLKLEKDAVDRKANKEDIDDKDREQARKRSLELAEQLERFIIPALPRLTVDDCTTEKLAKTMAEQQGRILLASAEPTFLENCTGRYSDRTNCEVYLQGHAGDPIRVDRVNRDSICIDDPRLSLACAVQNGALAAISDGGVLRDRGFWRRLPVLRAAHPARSA